MSQAYESDVPHEGIRNLLRFGALGCAGLAAATDPTALAVTLDTPYAIGGVVRNLQALDGVDFTAGSEQPSSTVCFYLVVVNAAGTVSTIQGVPASASEARLPPAPDDVAILGAVRISTSASATFEPSVTSLAAPGVTDTYANFSAYPSGGDPTGITFGASVAAGRFFTGVASFGDLVRATTASQLRLMAALNFFIGDQLFDKPATDNIPITASAAQPASTTRYYLISIDAAGTVTTSAGVTRTVPAPPVGSVAIGVMRVVTGAGTTFTPGTTALNAAGVTTTFANLVRYPRGGLVTTLTYA
jgi:hypothetical protein